MANGAVYVASFDGSAYALKASTGTKLWSYPSNSGYYSPAVADGVVYFGDSANVDALNATTGVLLWSYRAGQVAAAVANGVVYAGGGDNADALNASTGDLLWSSNVGIPYGSPAVANGVVYLGPLVITCMR